MRRRLRAAAPWILYAVGGLPVFYLSWTAAVSYTGIALLVATFRTPRRVPLILVLSPFLVVIPASFLWGCAAYAAGTARLLTSLPEGAFDPEADPHTRVPYRSTGRSAGGLEVLWQLPHNSAVRSLTTLFGPMPGAYAGPVPDLSEVNPILRRPYGWLSQARAEAIWRERAPGSLPPIDCGLCSSKEDPVAIVELDDRGLLVVDRHFARLYDRRTGLLYTTYPGVTMQCTPYITPPW